MITSLVAAIAISQREARRKKAALEAEAAEAAKKSILITSGNLIGLLAALFCRAQHFTVTIVDVRGVGELDSQERGLCVLTRGVLGALERAEEGLEDELRGRGREILHYRRAKSGKVLSKSDLSEERAVVIPAEELHAVLAKHTTSILRPNTRIVSYHDDPEDLDGPVPTGRPYALAHTGEKFYADCIICTDPVGRAHILKTADLTGQFQPEETGWMEYTGVLEDTDNPFSGQETEISSCYISPSATLTTLTNPNNELIFTLLHCAGTNPEEVLSEFKNIISQPIIDAAADVYSAPVTTLPKPTFLVSRKSRKLVLAGPNAAFRLPPHSSHLEFSIHIEYLATMAICLRKASSAPLGLEVFSRLRKPRDEEAWKMAEERTKSVKDAAEGEELEVGDLECSTEGEWWDYAADKEADKGFEGVIEQLTLELLGRQKAMLEAQAKAQEEAEKAEKEKTENRATPAVPAEKTAPANGAAAATTTTTAPAQAMPPPKPTISTQLPKDSKPQAPPPVSPSTQTTSLPEATTAVPPSAPPTSQPPIAPVEEEKKDEAIHSTTTLGAGEEAKPLMSDVPVGKRKESAEVKNIAEEMENARAAEERSLHQTNPVTKNPPLAVGSESKGTLPPSSSPPSNPLPSSPSAQSSPPDSALTTPNPSRSQPPASPPSRPSPIITSLLPPPLLLPSRPAIKPHAIPPPPNLTELIAPSNPKPSTSPRCSASTPNTGRPRPTSSIKSSPLLQRPRTSSSPSPSRVWPQRRSSLPLYLPPVRVVRGIGEVLEGIEFGIEDDDEVIDEKEEVAKQITFGLGIGGVGAIGMREENRGGLGEVEGGIFE